MFYWKEILPNFDFFNEYKNHSVKLVDFHELDTEIIQYFKNKSQC